MRKLTAHQVNECNEAIDIQTDEADSTRSTYFISLPNGGYTLRFQNGPIAEVGTNGLTHEALLAIIVDRMQGFQAGPFACRENALALTKLEEAQHWLLHRTRTREARGVEGTHTP